MQLSAHSERSSFLPKTRVFRFALVGVISTLIYFVLSLELRNTANLPPAFASFSAYCVAAVFSYFCHRVYTFCSNRAHSEAIPSFAGLSLAGYAISLILPWLMVGYLGFEMIVPVILTSITVPVINFFAMGRIVFKR